MSSHFRLLAGISLSVYSRQICYMIWYSCIVQMATNLVFIEQQWPSEEIGGGFINKKKGSKTNVLVTANIPNKC